MAGPFPSYQTALPRDNSLPLRVLADRILGYVKGAEPSCARFSRFIYICMSLLDCLAHSGNQGLLMSLPDNPPLQAEFLPFVSSDG